MRAARLSIAVIAVGASVAPPAGANTSFDSIPEGFQTHPFTIDGITFSNDEAVMFGIEDASASFAGLPGFSAPNVLSLGAVKPGPDASGTAGIHELTITIGQPATHAALDLIYIDPFAGNTVTLEAVSGGIVVDADPLLMADLPGSPWESVHLTVSAPSFDLVRLVSSGPAAGGAFGGWLDNVVLVPAPAATPALAIGLAIAARRRRRRTGP